jgi:ATP-dependent Clp protease adaptor protein ClpS
MTPLPERDRSKGSRDFDRSAKSSPAGFHRPIIRYRVVLHRSPDKDLMFIVRTVMELTHYCKEEATHRMWEAYHQGCSQILITHLERAELYAEQFADRGLKVSVEPTS